MKKTVLIAFFTCVLVGSCTNQQTATNKPIHTTKTVTNIIDANQFVTFEIKGMVCKMGCGSVIRKELLKTKSVVSCEIEYENNRQTNFVNVEFDQHKISTDSLIVIIEKLNHKQFKVVDIKDKEKQFKRIKKNASSVTIQSMEQDPQMEEATVDMPNLIDIYARLVTG